MAHIIYIPGLVGLQTQVLKDLVEVRQEWRNRWPFEDPAAAVAIQSIEMAVTSAVIKKQLGLQIG